MTDETISVKFGADTSGATAGVDQVKSKLGDLNSHVSNIAGEIKSHLVGAFAALASIEGLKKAIESTIEWQRETLSLSRTLGRTQASAATLAVALGEVHATSDQYLGAVAMLTRNLRSNEQGFQLLGVATRDANGNFRDTQSLMQDAFKALMQFKEGTDRNEMSMQIFGRRWEQVVDLMRLTPEVMEEAREKAHEFGVEMGPERVAEIEKFRHTLNDTKDMAQGLGLTVADETMPSLRALGEDFRAALPAASATLKVALAAVVTVFEVLLEVIESLSIIIKAFAAQLGVTAAMIVDISTHLAHLDWSGAKAAWRNGMNELNQIAEEAGKKIVETDRVHAERAARVWQDAGAALGVVDPRQKAPTRPGQQKSGTAEDSGSGTRSALDLSAEVAKAEALRELSRKLAADEAEDARNAAVTKLDIEKEELEAEVQLGTRTAAQQFQSLKATLDERMAAQRNYYAELAKIYSVDAEKAAKSEAEKKKIEAERIRASKQAKAAEMQYETQLAQLERKTILDTQKNYAQMFKAVETSATHSIQQMVKGQMTFRQAIRNVGESILDDFVAQQVHSVFVQQEAEAAKTAASTAGAAVRTTTETAAAATSTTVTAGAASKNILAHAWEAASGVYSSIASIPIVGPFLAPVMAIAAAALVAGYANRLMSASGGYDIPSGTNPMTQLHANEMVLPAQLADRVRNMTDSGRGKRDGGPININISAVDAASVKRLLLNNGDAISAALYRQTRMGR